MPFGDGTGPAGKGPRTGRGAGNCTGQGGTGHFGGRGLGLGRGGRGRGFNLGRGLSYSPDQERSWLEAALQSITERLDALKNDK
jgi:hypothetical protein